MTADRPVSAEVVTDDLIDVAQRAAENCSTGHACYPFLETCCVRAGLEVVVPLIRERLAVGLVAVDPADLRLVLDQDTAHYHQRPGVWDDDNPPERAGRPCVECAARGRLRVALDGDAPECREARAEIDAEPGRPA